MIYSSSLTCRLLPSKVVTWHFLQQLWTWHRTQTQSCMFYNKGCERCINVTRGPQSQSVEEPPVELMACEWLVYSRKEHWSTAVSPHFNSFGSGKISPIRFLHNVYTTKRASIEFKAMNRTNQPRYEARLWCKVKWRNWIKLCIK